MWKELYSQGIYYYMYFHRIEAWKESMLNVFNDKS